MRTIAIRINRTTGCTCARVASYRKRGTPAALVHGNYSAQWHYAIHPDRLAQR